MDVALKKEVLSMLLHSIFLLLIAQVVYLHYKKKENKKK